MLCPYCRTENRPGSTRCAACTSWMTDRPPLREWTRARHGTMVGGVAAGLSARFGVPVAAVRLGFVLATLLGFWGLAIYSVLWVVMPREPLAPPAYPVGYPGAYPPPTAAPPTGAA